MLTTSAVQEIMNRIQYRDWVFHVETHHLGWWLQVRFVDADGVQWQGRKWLLSPHMTVSEVVQTAFKAVLTAEEHEARERFLYNGAAVYGPHFDVEHLAILARFATPDVRPPEPPAWGTGQGMRVIDIATVQRNADVHPATVPGQ